jgi:hypothetical protein
LKVFIKKTYGGNRTYFNQIFLLEEISDLNPSTSFTNISNSNKSRSNISRDKRKSESNNLLISSLSPHHVEYNMDEIKYNPTKHNKEDMEDKYESDNDSYNDNNYDNENQFDRESIYDNNNSNFPERDYNIINKENTEESLDRENIRNNNINKCNSKNCNFKEIKK